MVVDRNSIEYVVGRMEALAETADARAADLKEHIMAVQRRQDEAIPDLVQQLSALSRSDATLKAKMDKLLEMHKDNHDNGKKSRWPRIVLFGGGSGALVTLGALIESLLR